MLAESSRLLRDLRSGKKKYEEKKTRDLIERCLGHLFWAQSLATIIRSVARFEEGDRLRRKWLDQKSSEGFHPADVLQTYRQSIRYVVNYIISRYAELDADTDSDPIRIVEAQDHELASSPLAPGMVRELAKRAEIPMETDKALDVERLDFPPIRLDGPDEHAPAFVIASLFVEALRNAYKYTSKQRSRLPERFIAWAVSESEACVCIQIVNPIVPEDEMPNVVSTALISRLAGWLGIGKIESGQTGKVTIWLHPQDLKRQPGE